MTISLKLSLILMLLLSLILRLLLAIEGIVVELLFELVTLSTEISPLTSSGGVRARVILDLLSGEGGT